MTERRFPSPWSIEERQESFIVKDANGQQLAYLYFELPAKFDVGCFPARHAARSLSR
jgi:hypothetical protein